MLLKSRNSQIVAARRRRDPLKTDPTRTGDIRRAFAAEISRRFRLLRGKVLDFIAVKDALDLGESSDIVVFNASPREFRFNTDPQKLEAFNAWFAEQVAAEIFFVPPDTAEERPWTAQYVESAYRRGVANAFLAAHAEKLGTKEDPNLTAFLLRAFSGPEMVSKVRLLYLRAFQELKGVTAAMGTEMSRILAQGLVDGRGPLAIARQLNASIRALTKRRALTIATTELTRAHAEGQLDSFERLGIKRLGLRAEWLTAEDDRVCPRCEAQAGKIYTLEQASGLIPLHPNCRCSWTPHL